MKNFKKILTVILAVVMCLNFGTIDSKAAASVSIALSSSSVSIGGSVSATVSVSGSDVSAYDIYVSYDASVLQYNSGSGAAQANGGGGTVRLVGTGAGSTTLSFTAIGNGSCYISTSGTECYDINYNQLAISHAGASVTVATPTNNDNNDNNDNNQNNDDKEDTTTEEDGRSSNCNLKSLKISPGTLEPAFSPSTTSYFVQVDEDVTSMVVSAVAEDEKATTAVRGAGLIEPGENTVTVTVTAENGAVKVYTLKVAAGEGLGDAKTTINGIEYSFVQSSNGLESPEGYKEITTEYKDWEVLAFESPNKKIVLVCLEAEVSEDEEVTQEWFIYNKEKETFTPYREYSSEFNRYVIIEAPEGVVIPDGFEKTELDVGGIGEKVVVYKSDSIKDRNIYLVYAINIAGDEGFYWYDAKEKTFLRYAQKEEPVISEELATETIATAAEPEKPEETKSKDEGFFSKKNLGIFAIGFGVLSFLLLITVITLAVLLKHKEDDDEDDDDVTGDLYDDMIKPVIKNNDKIDDTADFAEPVDSDKSKESFDNGESNTYDNSQLIKETLSTEEMAEEEARRAYEEDREISQNIPASYDLSKMKDNPASSEDRNISIMSFKKKDSKEEIKEVKEEAKEEIKEVKEEIKEEKKEVKEEEDASVDEIETIKFDFGSNEDSSLIDDEKKKRDYENDYAKQSEAINNKIKTDYDAEKDSAFSDESDK